MEYNNDDISSDLTERFNSSNTVTRNTQKVKTKKIKNNSLNKEPKKSSFKKFLKLYIGILVVLCLVFLVYVLNTLYQYEDSFTDNYMKSVVHDITKSAKKGKISKVCDVNNLQRNPLDNSSIDYSKTIQQIFKTENISYKLNNGTKNTGNPIYSIYANDQKIMEVTLKVKEQKQRLGLFSYSLWEVDNCKIDAPRGLEFFDIVVPSNYTVEVNGKKLTEQHVTKSVKNDEYEKFAEYVDMPQLITYELNNFADVPNIKITDENGKEVNTIITNNKIEIKDSTVVVNSYEDAKNKINGDIDILKLAENWSLFLTDDLSGVTHGFTNLKPYLIQGSNFCNMAYAWATSVDITFVSNHTLKNPAFTNEKLNNFTIYNKNAFSCDVYLEKNMKIANGQDKTDVMHDKLYFVYYDDTNDGVDNPSWKLIDMKSIVNQ